MKSTAILIPARYDSKRFPGKPLVDLNGKPMIKRVFDICKSTGLDTYVLTDDMRIFNLFGPCESWIEKTKDFANGTERCAAAATDENFIQYLGNYDRFINVQGDMPDVTVEMIEKCAESLSYNYSVSTVYTDMPKKMQDDPNSVKMVHGVLGAQRDLQFGGDQLLKHQRYPNQALWFGRGLTGYGEWHLGVYGYDRHALTAYPNLKVTQEETVEQLEQLRWLTNGWRIGAQKVNFSGIEINTPEDAERWNETE